MFGLGTMELVIIGVIVFLIFGAKRIPEIGKGLGGALREFKNVKRELSSTEPENNLQEHDREGAKDNTPTLEGTLAKKVLEQVPGAKKAVDINEKIKKVKEVMK
ncbi:twin-arginine translocase TatA/TatE family subunit [Thermodesulfobacteriota bacterium]